MFGKKDMENRFEIEEVSRRAEVRCYILTDKETGNQYLSTWVSTGGGITPLLDEQGNVTNIYNSK